MTEMRTIVNLTGGGRVELLVDLDLATAPLEAVEFVGALASAVRSYQGTQQAASAAPAANEPVIRPAAPRRPGRASTVDWPKVRQVAQRARRDGLSVPAALVVEFGVPMTTAKNWAQRCRREGWLDTDRVHVTVVDEPEPEPTPPAELIVRAEALHLVPTTTVEPEPAWCPAPDPAYALDTEPDCDIAGETIPADVTPDDEPEPEPPAEDAEDWSEVARVYLDAMANGQRPIAALARYFDLERSQVLHWPNECRRRGLLPPADEPQVPADLSGVRAAVPRTGGR